MANKKSKTEQLATSQLITYQQVIGLANEQMDQYATNMEEFLKVGKVSKRFYDDIVNELQPKVETNNKILSEIERELYDRVKRDYPGASLPNVMGPYFKKYHAELESQAKIKSDVARSIKEGKLAVGAPTSKDEKPVKKVNFNTEE